MNVTNLKFVNKNSISAGRTVTSHMHSCTEIVLYVSADGKTMIGEKEYDIKSGSIAVINGSSPHNEHHYSNCKVIFFGFDSNVELPFLPEGVYSKVNCFEKLQNIAECLYNEVKRQDEGHTLMIASMIVEFVVLFGRAVRKNHESDRSLDYCANYLRENYALPININELANEYGFDYERFRKDFKLIYGVAPKQFIVEQRLVNAYTMISESGMSCTDVAMYCGFSDGSQFSKMFKNRYGISPEKLRRSLG